MEFVWSSGQLWGVGGFPPSSVVLRTDLRQAGLCGKHFLPPELWPALVRWPQQKQRQLQEWAASGMEYLKSQVEVSFPLEVL